MSDANLSIGIVGHGAIGSALGKAFERSGCTVLYWDVDEQKRTIDTFANLVSQSSIIIIATPSWTNREVANQIKGAQNKLVISVAKGVEHGFVTLDKVLAECSKDSFDFGILHGPMLAEELEVNKPTSAILAVSNDKWIGCFDSSFTASKLKIDYDNDTHGIAACGVLKNIYAIAFGINDGLELGFNAKGTLAVKVFAEMKLVLEKLDINPLNADGLAGVGDLLATGWSESSFNHRIGKAIAQKIAPEERKGEGVNALGEIKEILNIVDYPVLNVLHQIVIADKDPNILETLIGK